MEPLIQSGRNLRARLHEHSGALSEGYSIVPTLSISESVASSLRSSMHRTTLVALIVSALALSACASIMHGTSQDVGISSTPTSASVTVDNATKGETPFVAKLSRKDNHIIHIAADGFQPADLTLTRSTSGWVWGNLLFGGIIGLAVDAITGGLYKLSPEQLSATLTKQQASVAPTKDGFYVVLVPAAEQGWLKVGQLQRATVGPLAGN